jgi:hypothetical protein
MTDLIKDDKGSLKKIAAAILVIDSAREVAQQAKKIGPMTVVPTHLILELREVLSIFDKTPV